jgi:adenylosuccinate synthase
VGNGPFPTELIDDVGERLRKVGREYGATTGRPRRCGWLDTVAIRYTSMINGVSSIALTKLDVLSGFDEIKLCTKYERISDGKIIEHFTNDLKALAKIRPVYESFAGWGETALEGITTRAALPKEVKTYLEAIEKNTGAPLGLISLGAGRNETIVEKGFLEVQ